MIPIECVYAVVEVKSFFGKAECEAALINMLSVKRLTKSEEAIVSPSGILMHSFSLYGREWESWPIQYFVFAFDSPDISTTRNIVDEMQRDYQCHERMDLVCILDKGILANRTPEGMFYGCPSPGSQLVASETKRPLLLFYTLASSILNQARMGSFNIKPYLRSISF